MAAPRLISPLSEHPAPGAPSSGPFCRGLDHLPLPTEPIRCVVADPPWRFGDALGRRGAAANYRTMTAAAIAALSLPKLADDCVLFLWRVAAMQEEALAVARAWGFQPKAELVWVKLTRRGLLHFGMGRHVRNPHEVILLCTRGRPQYRSRSIRSVFHGPVREHSRKPEEFYRLVEQLCDGPYLELFARAARPGWISVGDEVAKFTAQTRSP